MILRAEIWERHGVGMQVDLLGFIVNANTRNLAGGVDSCMIHLVDDIGLYQDLTKSIYVGLPSLLSIRY